MRTSPFRWTLGLVFMVVGYGLAVYYPHHRVVGYAACQSQFSPVAWYRNGCSNPPMRMAILGVGLVAAIITWFLAPVAERLTALTKHAA